MNVRKSRRGFSLIELLIVIALIGIVATFAVPTWKEYTAKNDLRTGAREIMADISETKQLAIASNLDAYCITFNLLGNSYTLTRTDTAETLWTKTLASFGSGIEIDSVTFNGSKINFQKRGTSSNGSVTLRNRFGSKARVTVNITGRTYVQFM